MLHEACFMSWLLYKTPDEHAASAVSRTGIDCMCIQQWCPSPFLQWFVLRPEANLWVQALPSRERVSKTYVSSPLHHFSEYGYLRSSLSRLGINCISNTLRAPQEQFGIMSAAQTTQRSMQHVCQHTSGAV